MKNIEETNEIELNVGDTVALPCGRVTKILEFETWDKDGQVCRDLITLATSTCRRDARVGVIPSEEWGKIMPNDPKVMFYFPREITLLHECRCGELWSSIAAKRNCHKCDIYMD